MIKLTRTQFYLAAIFGVANGYLCWKPLFEGKYLPENLAKEEIEKASKLSETQNEVRIYFEFVE